MPSSSKTNYKEKIRQSGFDIYKLIDIGDPIYWIPSKNLQELLNGALVGLSLAGLALRTRSKVVKSAVCEALGYPIPTSFRKTQPRFLGQNLDIYTQKSLNLQIWNEELSASRRYALIQISESDVIQKVKIVNGQDLAILDTTGTITRKYQAGIDGGLKSHELISQHDTDSLAPYTKSFHSISQSVSPVDEPTAQNLFSITTVFERLSSLVGKTFLDPGIDQERNRGAELHRLVSEQLGYHKYEDNGQFPDIRNQVLEIKLQTSRTIDLGLVLPNSTDRIDMASIGTFHPRHCDTRYAIFVASTDGKLVTLTNLIITTGADFFTRFRRFEGRISNGKIQIPLGRNFFCG